MPSITDRLLQHVLQVRVPDFDFIGCGEAGSKKDAQSLAARSYCKFLVDQGLLDPSTLPGPLEDEASLIYMYTCTCMYTGEIMSNFPN